MSGGTTLMAKASPELPGRADGRRGALFILYTSGSTGKPKGVRARRPATTCMRRRRSEWVFDHREDDVFSGAADIGWITGHSYIVYGRSRPGQRA